MTKQLELKAEIVRRGWRYRDMAHEARARGLDVEGDDVLAIVNGKRNPDERLRKIFSEILGRPSFELFVRGGQ